MRRWRRCRVFWRGRGWSLSRRSVSRRKVEQERHTSTPHSLTPHFLTPPPSTSLLIHNTITLFLTHPTLYHPLPHSSLARHHHSQNDGDQMENDERWLVCVYARVWSHIHLHMHSTFVCLSVYLPACLSVCLSGCLSDCQTI